MTAIEPTEQNPLPEQTPATEQAPAPEPTPTAEQAAATEQTPAPEQPAVAPDQHAAATDQPADATEQPAVAPRTDRKLLRASAAVLAAVLVGVGIGEVIIKTAYDDPATVQAAAPAQPSASASAAFGAKSNGNHFGSLRDLLLPLPSTYELGPDNGAFGNDNEFGPDELQKRYEAFVQEVPDKYRDGAKAAWDSLHYKAAGVRTFQSRAYDLVVSISLDQFNQQAISQEAQLYGAMVDDTGVFRQGPAVPGHDAARCVLPPLRAGDELDYMYCFSAEGDLMVSLDASGVAPLDQNKVVDLFRQQLDRLARPGASA